MFFYTLIPCLRKETHLTHIQICLVSGKCPPTDDNKECPPSEFIWDQCVTDVDCDEGFRCCSDGCQLGCVEVKAVQTDEDTSGKIFHFWNR